MVKSFSYEELSNASGEDLVSYWSANEKAFGI